jgi:hypothetical protein
MCRNIKTLFKFEPPATGAEIQTAALQFSRKKPVHMKVVLPRK